MFFIDKLLKTAQSYVTSFPVVPARKSSSAASAPGPGPDDRPAPTGAEGGFSRACPSTQPSLPGPPRPEDDPQRLGQCNGAPGYMETLE